MKQAFCLYARMYHLHPTEWSEMLHTDTDRNTGEGLNWDNDSGRECGCSFVSGNTLLMKEFRVEWTDWFEFTTRLKELK